LVNRWWGSGQPVNRWWVREQLVKIRWGFPHSKFWFQQKFLPSIFLQAVNHFHQVGVLHFLWVLPISAYLLAPVVVAVVVATVPPPVVIDLAITEELVVQVEMDKDIIMTELMVVEELQELPEDAQLMEVLVKMERREEMVVIGEIKPQMPQIILVRQDLQLLELLERDIH
jgi:hypothetical protein